MPKKAALPLSDIERGILSDAERLLFVEDDYEEAIHLLDPLFRKHETDDDLLSVYLPALLCANRCVLLSDERAEDSVQAQLFLCDQEFRKGDLLSAAAALSSAEHSCPSSPLVKARKVLYYALRYEKDHKDADLNEARRLAQSIGICDTHLEMSWAAFAMAIADNPLGMLHDGKLPFTRKDAQEKGLYFLVSIGAFVLPGDTLTKMANVIRRANADSGRTAPDVSDEDKRVAFAILNIAEGQYRERGLRDGIWAVKTWFSLAVMYEDGDGTSQNYTKAVELYDKCLKIVLDAKNQVKDQVEYPLSCLYFSRIQGGQWRYPLSYIGSRDFNISGIVNQCSTCELKEIGGVRRRNDTAAGEVARLEFFRRYVQGEGEPQDCEVAAKWLDRLSQNERRALGEELVNKLWERVNKVRRENVAREKKRHAKERHASFLSFCVCFCFSLLPALFASGVWYFRVSSLMPIRAYIVVGCAAFASLVFLCKFIRRGSYEGYNIWQYVLYGLLMVLSVFALPNDIELSATLKIRDAPLVVATSSLFVALCLPPKFDVKVFALTIMGICSAILSLSGHEIMGAIMGVEYLGLCVRSPDPDQESGMWFLLSVSILLVAWLSLAGHWMLSLIAALWVSILVIPGVAVGNSD